MIITKNRRFSMTSSSPREILNHFQADGFYVFIRTTSLPIHIPGVPPPWKRKFYEYALIDGKDKVFHGYSFSPSVGTPASSVEALFELVETLCTRPEDTDEDLFKYHTKRQMKWLSSSRRDDLLDVIEEARK